MTPLLVPPSAVAPPDRLAEALYPAGLGWPVFPLHHPVKVGGVTVCSCGNRKGKRKGNCDPSSERNDIGKHPRTRNGCKAATTDATKIRAWWTKEPSANVGIATGGASGLLVIDIDPRNGGDATLRELEARHGPLPHTAEVLTGGGGRHLYFRHPGGDTRGELGEGVDVKADGGYVVAPESMHKSGNPYTWRPGHSPEEVGVAALPATWTKAAQRGTAAPECHRVCREVGKYDDTTTHPPVPMTQPAPVPMTSAAMSVDEVLAACRVTGPGKHDTKTNDLARGLKLNAGIKTLEEARPHFDRFYAAALPYLSDKDEDDAWAKFRRAFEQCLFPLGVKPAEQALALADRLPYPPCASRYKTPEWRRLVAWVAQLQALVGDAPFRFSGAMVAKGLKLPGTDVAANQKGHRMLKTLEDDTLLKCVVRGVFKVGCVDASQWRYTGGVPATDAKAVA